MARAQTPTLLTAAASLSSNLVRVTQKEMINKRLATRVRGSGLRLIQAATTEPITSIPGDCGGSISGSITTDSTTGAMSGSIVIDNFCSTAAGASQLLADGDLSFNGTLNPQSGATNLTLISKGLTVHSGDSGFSASFNLTLSSNDTTVTINAPSFSVSSTRNGGKTVSGQNVLVTMQTNPTTLQTSVSVSGTLSDSELGNMAVSTWSPLVISDQGILLSGSGTVTGANNSLAHITCTGNSHFTVDVDENGDGTYDGASRAMDCSQLNLGSLTGLNIL